MKNKEGWDQAEADLMRIQAICQQRGEAFFGMWLDGINTLVMKARAGDRGARIALKQAQDALDEAKRLVSIALPGDA